MLRYPCPRWIDRAPLLFLGSQIHLRGREPRHLSARVLLQRTARYEPKALQVARAPLQHPNQFLRLRGPLPRRWQDLTGPQRQRPFHTRHTGAGPMPAAVALSIPGTSSSNWDSGRSTFFKHHCDPPLFFVLSDNHGSPFIGGSHIISLTL